MKLPMTMTEPEHKNDILIADGVWIGVKDLDGCYAQAHEVDPCLHGLWELLARLETQCVASCCGFDAYDFSCAAVHAALDAPDADAHAWRKALAQAVQGIATAPEVLVSSTMNNYVDRPALLQLLAHLERCISSYQRPA